MSTPAQVTEAHVSLVATIVERAFRFAEKNHKITPELSQLIADSEARATDQLRAEVERLKHGTVAQFKDAFIDELKRENTELREWQAGVIANEKSHHAERKEARARAERAEAELTIAKRDTNNLNNLLRAVGWGQGEIDSAACIEEENEKLRAERDSIKQEIEMVEHRAYRAEAKISNQAERIRYLEGATNHATGTPLSLAMARAERAEAELKAEQDNSAINEIELRVIVSKIWVQLGSPTCEQLKGRSIYDLIDELKAELAKERARLDWLMAGGVCMVQHTGGFHVSRLHAPVSRAAIDAAMKEGA